MPPEAGPPGGAANLVVRRAGPAEYEAIGELTVRAYATLEEPLKGGRV